MIVFAAIGMLAALVVAFILLRDGINTIRLMLGFTGTVNNPDGLIGIAFVAVGLAILGGLGYFLTFHVSLH